MAKKKKTRMSEPKRWGIYMIQGNHKDGKRVPFTMYDDQEMRSFKKRCLLMDSTDQSEEALDAITWVLTTEDAILRMVHLHEIPSLFEYRDVATIRFFTTTYAPYTLWDRIKRKICHWRGKPFIGKPNNSVDVDVMG